LVLFASTTVSCAGRSATRYQAAREPLPRVPTAFQGSKCVRGGLQRTRYQVKARYQVRENALLIHSFLTLKGRRFLPAVICHHIRRGTRVGVTIRCRLAWASDVICLCVFCVGSLCGPPLRSSAGSSPLCGSPVDGVLPCRVPVSRGICSSSCLSLVLTLSLLKVLCSY